MILEKEDQIIIEKAKQFLADISFKNLKNDLTEKEKQTFEASFWQSKNAQKIMKEISLVKENISDYSSVKSSLDDIEAYELLIKEAQKDESSNSQNNQTNELVQELKTLLKKLEKQLKKLQLKQYLSGKYDTYSAVVSIHSGQGGTEAMDWAEMLKRMYSRYFERKGWKAKLTSESRGEEAGIKSCEYEIEAPYSYGFLKNEQGTHRLVRLSPFNADNLRQTSFALVEVLPLLNDSDDEISLPDSDLDWNFTRSGGAGGQSVNKTSSAVELTHTPTGIVVKCREERSQVQNKEKALKKLKSKLASLEAKKLSAELAKEKGEHIEASWGNQIRNYVLHPYKLVKDTRTSIETSDTEAVLDGDIEMFIQEEIKL